MSEQSERPYLTLGQAARATGLSKATISKAVKDGRLSVANRGPGGYQIDPAELARVFPLTGYPNGITEQSERPAEQSERLQETLAARAAALAARLEELEKRLQEKDELLRDYRRRLDLAEEERRRLTEKLSVLLLPGPAEAGRQSKPPWWKFWQR